MRLERQYVWTIGLLLALWVLCMVWFFTNFEEVPTISRSNAGVMARRNPILVAQLFLTKMGRRPEMTTDPSALDQLRPGGVLILGLGRRQFMTPARVASVLQWVRQGGQLIAPVGAEGPDDNEPFLKTFGLSWKEVDPKEDAIAKAPPANANPPKNGRVDPARDAKVAPKDPVMLVTIPGARRALTARGQEFFMVGLKVGTRAPAWIASTPAGAQLLQFREGAGAVTFVTFLRPLVSNDSLTDADNAELFWTILNSVSRTGPIVWMTNLHVPTLWEWFRTKGVTILFAASVLLLLWLWHEVPRFGPSRAEPARERRALGEHLYSMGFAVWRNGGGGGLQYWLSEVRAYVLARVALREPVVGGASDANIVERVVALTGLPSVQVQAAFIAIPDDRSAAARKAFLRSMVVWQEIDRKLGESNP